MTGADLADVRFFTLTSIVKIAQRSAAQQRAGLPRGPAQAGRHDANAGADDEEGWGAGSEDGSSGGESEGEDEGAASAGEGGKRVTHADLARTLHDILAGMRPEAPGLGLGPGGASGKHDAGKGEEQEEEKDEEEEGGAAGLRSWCGAAEVGIVAAANAGEGARQRKRQRRLLGQADAGSDEPQLRAKWANAKAQQRMFRCVCCCVCLCGCVGGCGGAGGGCVLGQVPGMGPCRLQACERGHRACMAVAKHSRSTASCKLCRSARIMRPLAPGAQLPLPRVAGRAARRAPSPLAPAALPDAAGFLANLLSTRLQRRLAGAASHGLPGGCA